MWCFNQKRRMCVFVCLGVLLSLFLNFLGSCCGFYKPDDLRIRERSIFYAFLFVVLVVAHVVSCESAVIVVSCSVWVCLSLLLLYLLLPVLSCHQWQLQRQSCLMCVFFLSVCLFINALFFLLPIFFFFLPSFFIFSLLSSQPIYIY